MGIHNNAMAGAAGSATIGSVIASSGSDAGVRIGGALGNQWNSGNAFQAQSTFWKNVAGAALAVSVSVGLIHWHGDFNGPAWAVWVGFLGLVLCIYAPIALSISFMRMANARLLTRVFPVFSDSWMMAAEVYRRGNMFSQLLLAILYLVIGPVVLIADALRFVRFVGLKLSGKDVVWGNAKALYQVRLSKGIKRVLANKGPETADKYRYLAWKVVEASPIACRKLTYTDWKQSVRAQVVAEKGKRFG